jgi:hypothetical protein
MCNYGLPRLGRPRFVPAQANAEPIHVFPQPTILDKLGHWNHRRFSSSDGELLDSFSVYAASKIALAMAERVPSCWSYSS